MRAKDTRIFLLELGTLYQSGIPIRESLESLARSPHGPIGRVAERLAEQVSRGASLAEGLRHEGFLLPEYVAIIDAAERTGEVPEVLRRLGKELEAREAMRDRLVKRLLYPVAMYLLAFLLPALHLIFTGQYLEYLWVQVYGFGPVLLGAMLFVVLRWQFRQNASVRRLLEAPLLAIPFLGSTWLRLVLGRSLGLLGLLLRGGLSLRESFELTEKAASFDRLARGFREAAGVVERGGTLDEGMSRMREIPDLQRQQIATGERSGTMDEAFERCGDQLTESALSNLDAFLRLLPILVYLLAAFMVFSMFGRILQLGSF